jgi:nitrile hydratase
MSKLPAPEGRIPAALRAEALEQLLVERKLLDTAVMDKLISTYENDVGPLNGARVVARAWVDPDYKKRLLENGTGAIAELGYKGPQGEHIVVLENGPGVHHLVVCTLCSCYPWPVLGLPPSWYKDPAYRAKAVRFPRQLLAEFGLELGDDVEIKVWDSSSEVRYMVLPERPEGTEDMTEEQLAALVTREAMTGVALARMAVGG